MTNYRQTTERNGIDTDVAGIAVAVTNLDLPDPDRDTLRGKLVRFLGRVRP